MAKEKCDICKGKMGVCTARLPKCRWVIIQPGERLNGIQEVSGSIPLISTKKTVDATASAVFLFIRNLPPCPVHAFFYISTSLYIAI